MKNKSERIALSLCREGERLTIAGLSGSGAFRTRLIEMGFTKGTVVEIVRYAPLRDPMELVVRNFHVSLRVEEAARILVTRPD